MLNGIKAGVILAGIAVAVAVPTVVEARARHAKLSKHTSVTHVASRHGATATVSKHAVQPATHATRKAHVLHKTASKTAVKHKSLKHIGK